MVVVGGRRAGVGGWRWVLVVGERWALEERGEDGWGAEGEAEGVGD
jgi:hypothetical protein